MPITELNKDIDAWFNELSEYCLDKCNESCCLGSKALRMNREQAEEMFPDYFKKPEAENKDETRGMWQKIASFFAQKSRYPIDLSRLQNNQMTFMLAQDGIGVISRVGDEYTFSIPDHSQFSTCPKYDCEKKTCGMYTNRPATCREYPLELNHDERTIKMLGCDAIASHGLRDKLADICDKHDYVMLIPRSSYCEITGTINNFSENTPSWLVYGKNVIR
ncbi:MAG: hypothetical protein V1870_02335 [Candidatus Aenigmatarchaeota archaeon]